MKIQQIPLPRFPCPHVQLNHQPGIRATTGVLTDMIKLRFVFSIFVLKGHNLYVLFVSRYFFPT